MTKAQFLEKSKDVLGEQAGMMGEALFRSNHCHDFIPVDAVVMGR